MPGSATVSVPKRARRTQAERRATTRAALLDATIDCLVEFGYVNTTTTRVAQAAGVSRGAQVHHFPTKAELVSQAVAHLARRRIEELAPRFRALAARPDPIRELLDLVWTSHAGAVFDATLELWVAARTDPELRKRILELEREVTSSIWEECEAVFGERAHRPEFRDTFEFALATIRGVALLRASSGENARSVRRRWTSARDRLVPMFEAAPD